MAVRQSLVASHAATVSIAICPSANNRTCKKTMATSLFPITICGASPKPANSARCSRLIEPLGSRISMAGDRSFLHPMGGAYPHCAPADFVPPTRSTLSCTGVDEALYRPRCTRRLIQMIGIALRILTITACWADAPKMELRLNRVSGPAQATWDTTIDLRMEIVNASTRDVPAGNLLWRLRRRNGK